jgi:carbon storage regulator
VLVLRRRQGESIILSSVIKITVLSVEGDRVKLGITAPPDVIVVREELLNDRGSAAPHTTTPPYSDSAVIDDDS